MKIRILLLVLSTFMCLALLTNIFCITALGETRLEIIGEPTKYLYRVDEHPSKYYYKINVTFHNSGDEQSVPINIKIYEDGRSTIAPAEYQGVSFNPNETKTFSFNWSTPFISETIEIVYSPKDSRYASEYNQGVIPVEIVYADKTGEEGTPGFEFPLIILTSFILMFINYFKTKKHN